MKYARYPSGCLILSADYCILFNYFLLKLADLSNGITLVSFNKHYNSFKLSFVYLNINFNDIKPKYCTHYWALCL